jgi:hypothetical protein
MTDILQEKKKEALYLMDIHAFVSIVSFSILISQTLVA